LCGEISFGLEAEEQRSSSLLAWSVNMLIVKLATCPPVRIYDDPSEVHRWSIARRVLRAGGIAS